MKRLVVEWLSIGNVITHTHTHTQIIGINHKHLRSRCGQCEGCLRADCGQCTECLDKKKFGGPGRKTKACKYRKSSGITNKTNKTLQESINTIISSFADQYRKHRIT